MFVFVKVNARGEFKYVPRARRFWPAGATIKVEVRDKEPDDIVTKNSEGIEVGAPPLDILGPESYEALKKDPQNRFTILSDLESQASISQESVHAARQEVQKLGGRVVDLETENAELKKDLEEAESEIEAAREAAAKGNARIAELEAQLRNLATPTSGIGDPATVGDEAKPAKGKAK